MFARTTSVMAMRSARTSADVHIASAAASCDMASVRAGTAVAAAANAWSQHPAPTSMDCVQHHGLIAIPHGSRPTLTDLRAFRVDVSITVMSLVSPFAT